MNHRLLPGAALLRQFQPPARANPLHHPAPAPVPLRIALAPAPALLTEPEEQAITAGRERKVTGGVDVSEGHGGRSAGRHLPAGRGQGPTTIPRCAALCGTTDSKPRAWLRSLTPPRTVKRAAQGFEGYGALRQPSQRRGCIPTEGKPQIRPVKAAQGFDGAAAEPLSDLPCAPPRTRVGVRRDKSLIYAASASITPTQTNKGRFLSWPSKTSAPLDPPSSRQIAGPRSSASTPFSRAKWMGHLLRREPFHQRNAHAGGAGAPPSEWFGGRLLRFPARMNTPPRDVAFAAVSLRLRACEGCPRHHPAVGAPGCGKPRGSGLGAGGQRHSGTGPRRESTGRGAAACLYLHGGA